SSIAPGCCAGAVCLARSATVLLTLENAFGCIGAVRGIATEGSALTGTAVGAAAIITGEVPPPGVSPLLAAVPAPEKFGVPGASVAPLGEAANSPERLPPGISMGPRGATGARPM